MIDTVVLDVDGTLVDSSYHHLMAWAQAFEAVGVPVPLWRLHACMGMGGDHLVAAAAGDQVEREHGDEVRERWRRAYDELLGRVRPLPGAADTVRSLAGEVQVVLATSGNAEHIDRTLSLLGFGREEFPLVSSADVPSTKPAPDLVRRALQTVGAAHGLLVGDTVWDVEAGVRADVPVIGVRSGGVAAERLLEAGAWHVVDDVAAFGDRFGSLREDDGQHARWQRLPSA